MITWLNGKEVTTIEKIKVIMWYWGIDAVEARKELYNIPETKLQEAVDYYASKF